MQFGAATICANWFIPTADRPIPRLPIRLFGLAMVITFTFETTFFAYASYFRALKPKGVSGSDDLFQQLTASLIRGDKIAILALMIAFANTSFTIIFAMLLRLVKASTHG